MTDSTIIQLSKLRTSLKGLESQRSILGADIIEPALEALRQQIASLEARIPTEIPANEKKHPEERRIVTIFFSDIVGSTSLAGKLDPEDWGAILSRVHSLGGQVIQAHQGKVIQYLGDGLLAIFGAEEMSESDSENAILAALEFQAKLAELTLNSPVRLRIGINTGLVVIGEFGSEARKEYTALGDAMNIAARLQTLAPPGGVVISSETYRFVRGVFDVIPQPLVKVKGKEDAIQTYQVIRALPFSFRKTTRGVSGIVSPIVGRDGELQRVLEGYYCAINNRGVSWVQLIGDPGIGKSRLVEEVLANLQKPSQDFNLFKVRSIQGDEKQPFMLFRRFWFDRFHIADDQPADEAEKDWVENMQSLGLKDDDAQILGLLIGLPFFESAALGRKSVDPEQVIGRATVISRNLFSLLRINSPIVILLDDIHWADPASWEFFLDFIQGQIQTTDDGQGLFILSTARSEWIPPEKFKTNIIQIPLSPLDQDDSLKLASELFRKVDNISEELVQLVVQRSEGIPYYMEEVINWLVDQGILLPGQESWQFIPHRFVNFPIPQTLQSLLLSRVDSISENDRFILQCGSIFGRYFWEGGITSISNRNKPDLKKENNISPIMSILQRRGFVDYQSRSTFIDETEWSFHHNLLRDVVYESILKKERKLLHTAAADWIEIRAREAGRLEEFSGLLGEHTERAGLLRAASSWFLRAGEYAREHGAFQEARQFYDRAMSYSESEELSTRWQILLGRSETLGILGDMDARKMDDDTLFEIARESGNESWLAEAYYRNGSRLHKIGEDLEALQAFRNGLTAAKADKDENRESQILGIMVPCLVRLGRLNEAAEIVEPVLGLASKLNNEETLARVLINVSLYYLAIGDQDRSIQLLTQQVDTCHRIGNYVGESAGLGNLGYTYLMLGLFSEGLTALERSLSLSDSVGHRHQSAYTGLNIGMGYWRKGDFSMAYIHLDRTIQELRQLGDPFGVASGLLYRALVLETEGKLPSAMNEFENAREAFEELNVTGSLIDTKAGLARCQRKIGQGIKAYQLAQECWEGILQSGPQGIEFPMLVYQSCFEVFRDAGELNKADQVLVSGHEELMKRVNNIQEYNWRNTYLTAIPEHLWIDRAWEQAAVNI